MQMLHNYMHVVTYYVTHVVVYLHVLIGFIREVQSSILISILYNLQN